jgi:hypothetical protein
MLLVLSCFAGLVTGFEVMRIAYFGRYRKGSLGQQTAASSSLFH